jgi:ribosome-binding factor A
VSYRANRLAEEIKRVITDTLQTELKDPRISPFTSITMVDVSKDLRHAKVYVSVLGDEDDQEKTIEGLQSAGGFIRSELGKQIRLRYHPELTFFIDKSIQHGLKITRILRELADEEGVED